MKFESLYQDFTSHRSPVAVVGLGYVGLPLAVHMASKFKTIGFDIQPDRIKALREGIDESGEVASEELSGTNIEFTDDSTVLRDAMMIFVAVPTPVDEAHSPNLSPLIAASHTIGKQLRPGAVVVYESTVYPGVTEKVCGPALEESSGLVCGNTFFLGYSPERINPGDKVHTFDKVTKVVSGQNKDVLELVSRVYSDVVTAGVFEATNIQTAEAAKVIENTQRDLNIAFMNELAILFDTIGLDTLSVLEAAGTKWNFLNFRPGLVGGHCIGVDPYYLTYLAQTQGYHPRVILSGRQINDSMGKFVAEQTIKTMIKARHDIAESRILMLGLTFKEDVSDTRNSKVFDVIEELREYEVNVLLHDPMVIPGELKEWYGETMVDLNETEKVDGIVLAVGHEYYHQLGLEKLCGMVREKGVFIDVKGLFDAEQVKAYGLRYWRL